MNGLSKLSALKDVLSPTEFDKRLAELLNERMVKRLSNLLQQEQPKKARKPKTKKG